MFVGPMTSVVVRFDGAAKRYVLRRRVHESQRVVAEHADGAVDLAMDIAGTVELESTVLSYGDKAEVRSPPALRKKLGEVLRAGRGEVRASGLVTVVSALERVMRGGGGGSVWSRHPPSKTPPPPAPRP